MGCFQPLFHWIYFCFLSVLLVLLFHGFWCTNGVPHFSEALLCSFFSFLFSPLFLREPLGTRTSPSSVANEVNSFRKKLGAISFMNSLGHTGKITKPKLWNREWKNGMFFFEWHPHLRSLALSCGLLSLPRVVWNHSLLGIGAPVFPTVLYKRAPTSWEHSAGTEPLQLAVGQDEKWWRPPPPRRKAFSPRSWSSWRQDLK